MAIAVEQLLRQTEGKTLEFKRDLSSPRPLLRTLVAFANSAGGRLIAGVDDDRHVLGLAVKAARFGAMQREDLWSIPLTMLREAIVNALVHSDYSQRGTPLRIAFFDQRIDIESPGSLLPGMTVDDMKAGISRIRNPVIARVFRELRLIEQWGSGVRRIFAEAAKRGLPEPVITETATGLRFQVLLAEPHVATVVGEQVGEQVSEQVAQLLALCAMQPRSKQELLAALQLKNAYLSYKRHLAPLVAQGLLALTIPDKPQSRLQKYRLTAAGQHALRKHQDTQASR